MIPVASFLRMAAVGSIIGLAATVVAAAADGQTVFLIGVPDASASEFGLAEPGEGYTAFPRRFAQPVVWTAGRSSPREWPYLHPAIKDVWAGGKAHTFTIRFRSDAAQQRPWWLFLGLAGGSPTERSEVVVSVNGHSLPAQRAPAGDPKAAFDPANPGTPALMRFEIPSGSVRQGDNALCIRLDRESWILYDYVALRQVDQPLPIVRKSPRDLIAQFRRGPMASVEKTVFAVRRSGEDPHWYANFGYTLDHSNWKTYHDGGRLCVLDVPSGRVATLLDDPRGNVRDPQVDYDGRTLVFAYRPGGTVHYHLYQIGVDGSGLRRITDGPFDDVEPTWLPDGDVMFVSTRCRRRVNCHTTQTAVLYRCRRDGSGLRELSSNNEHDNTPWPLPNGQILYTRWEYVDRNQMAFHHLWTANPDGTRQTVFYGNMQPPDTTMIDGKPIPGSRKIVASFSPGHGLRDHDGYITVVDPRHGPDTLAAAKRITRTYDFRDPWAFSEDAFLAARGAEIVVVDGAGAFAALYRLPAADAASGYQCHEPRPVAARPREPVVPAATDWGQATGRIVVADVTRGRNMAGVRPGEIKKLLVLETLPKPMNYTGGMEPISYGGSFTLERILGTIPVEDDGSAYAEVPALRSSFFVALDENERSVKRMQSFFCVEPGETASCVGCHEQRSQTPPQHAGGVRALRRPPSRIEPFADVPDVLDFPRDVQPILDRHCVRCHDEDRRDGGVSLSGDRGPIFSISYFTLTARNLVADGRNGLGNRPPRSIGSSASRLLKLCDGSHYGAKPPPHEQRVLRLWIDTGAAYPGTYASLGTGMIGAFEIVDRSIRLDRSDLKWPSVQKAVATMQRRCVGCHDANRPLPLSPSAKVGPGGWYGAFDGAPPWVDLTVDDVRRRWSRHLMYNLSRPEKSLLLLAPLAKSAGGLQSCGKAVYADLGDADYQAVLAAVRDAKAKLDSIKRFDMPGFRPRKEYVVEMQRFGLLPPEVPESTPLDVYALDRAYWQLLWHRPAPHTSPKR